MLKTRLLIASAILAASPAFADTLFTNANGIQADAKGNLVRFDGMLVGDDGKVKAVLQKGRARPAADKVVDLGGRAVLPGLIDAHGHVMGLGYALIQLDLTGSASVNDLKQRLKDYAAANPGKGWIIGRGWNQELWPTKAFPTSADLDAVVADRPVWLTRVDGHAAVGNSAALAAAGVTPTTVAPAGGRIENGLFVDAALPLVTDKIPMPDNAIQDRAFAAAQQAMLRYGLVGAADMGTSLLDWNTFRRSGEAGNLNVRIFSYAAGLDNWRSIFGGRTTAWMYDDRLRLTGTKLYADGALGSRGAYLKAPYHDMPGTRGLSLISAADLLAQADEVARARGQLAVHAIGDAANAEVIGVFETLSQTIWQGAPVANRTSADRRPQGFAAPQTGRDHRVDAAYPPDQRPDDGRSATGYEPARRRLRLEHDPQDGRPIGVRKRLSGRKSRPVPRPVRRNQPAGSERRTQRRLASAGARVIGSGDPRLHHRRGLCRIRGNADGRTCSGQMGGLHHRRPRSRRERSANTGEDHRAGNLDCGKTSLQRS